MATHAANAPVPYANSIPLLDASNLPFADDWAFIEAIQLDADTGDREPDFDRFGRFTVAASFDE